ncbi:hypothetical protein OK016_09300 [Vibrio chagasii]|nr:hypothetical protein [Vibrio chagasii]
MLKTRSCCSVAFDAEGNATKAAQGWAREEVTVLLLSKLTV